MVEVQQVREVDSTQQMPQASLNPEYLRQPGLALEQFAHQSLRIVRAYDNEQKRLALYDAETKINDFATQQNIALNEQARHSTNGIGFAQQATDNYAAAEQKLTASIDPKVADRVGPRIAAVRQQHTLGAYKTEQTLNDNWQLDKTKDDISDAQKQIYADPTTYDAAAENVNQRVDSTSLPDATKYNIKKEFARNYGPKSYLDGMLVADPRRAREELGGPSQLGQGTQTRSLPPITNFDRGAYAPGDGVPHQSTARDLGINGVPPMADITLPNGVKMQVAAPYAHQAANFMQGMIERGYTPSSVSSFRPGSTVAGTNGSPSFHSLGLAFDLNPGNNEPNTGGKNDLPKDVDEWAKANGMIWGGHFGPGASHQDTMHFKIDKAIKPGELPATQNPVSFDVKGATPLQIGGAEVGKTASNVPVAPTITDPRKLTAIQIIRDEAVKQGLNPDTATAIAFLENRNFDPDSVSASGMRGVFQLDKSHRDRYGAGDDFTSQVSGGVSSVLERQNSASKYLGRNAEPWETYLFHYQGEGGGAAILNAMKSDPNTPVDQALLKGGLSPGLVNTIMRTNPDMVSKSVQQFTDMIKTKVNNALSATGGKVDPSQPVTAPVYKDVPYETINQYRQQAAKAVDALDQADAKLQTDFSKQVQEATLKQMYELHAIGKLTEDIVFQNVNNVDATHYKQLLDMVSGSKVKKENDPDTFIRLKTLAADSSKGDQAMSEAADALSKNKITWQTYHEVYKDTQNAQKPERNEIQLGVLRGALNSELEVGKQLISPQLIGGLHDPNAELRYHKYKRDMETWYANNYRSATPEDIRQASENIYKPIVQKQQTDNDVLGGMTFLNANGFKVTDVAKVEIGMIEKASAKVLELHKAGKLTQDELVIRSRQLNAVGVAALQKRGTGK